MFPNNPWEPTNPFWQNMQNNEQEDRYRRDPRTGEVGYYPMPPTSPHPTTQPMPPYFGYYSQPPFFPSNMPPPNIPVTQDTSETEYVPENQVESSSIKKEAIKRRMRRMRLKNVPLRR
ncbi:hypothetical protein HanIR_Chr09g0400231 [Helianthus annuus]|nr:hypothetical protein HanIR_Chr09g0400231 [Helianthus annuus]